MSPTERKTLEQLSIVEGISMTQILKNALRRYVDCEHKPYPCPKKGELK
jgi:hypothetical protein